MKQVVLGLHHITAIAGEPQRNYDFYCKLLGLRFIKRTVNFDDPGTFRFYFGNEDGSPGSILSFLHSNNLAPGRPGTGQASVVGLSVPSGSFPFWLARLEARQIPYRLLDERFGEPCLAFSDPDGLSLELIVSNTPESAVPGRRRRRGPK
jgi:glyoxalase family protein